MGLFSSIGSGLTGALGALSPTSLIGTGLSMGSSLIGAYSSAKSVRDENQAAMERQQSQENFQREMFTKDTDFQQASADRQMDFQERMSDTAYTRAVKGMREAGINPMLAVSQGGASTPTGSSASGASFSGSAAPVEKVPPILPTFISSALDTIKTVADVKQSLAVADETKSRADLNKLKIPEAQTGSDIWSSLDKVVNRAIGGLTNARDTAKYYFDNHNKDVENENLYEKGNRDFRNIHLFDTSY